MQNKIPNLFQIIKLKQVNANLYKEHIKGDEFQWTKNKARKLEWELYHY